MSLRLQDLDIDLCEGVDYRLRITGSVFTYVGPATNRFGTSDPYTAIIQWAGADEPTTRSHQLLHGCRIEPVNQ